MQSVFVVGCYVHCEDLEGGFLLKTGTWLFTVFPVQDLTNFVGPLPTVVPNRHLKLEYLKLRYLIEL